MEALVDATCEGHAVDRLMTFNFAGIIDKLEDALSFKARHAEPTARPFYSRILYTWYTSRGDYRNGECTFRPYAGSDHSSRPLGQLR